VWTATPRQPPQRQTALSTGV
jgi:hypothetical protein